MKSGKTFLNTFHENLKLDTTVNLPRSTYDLAREVYSKPVTIKLVLLGVVFRKPHPTIELIWKGKKIMKSDPNNDDNYCNLGVTNDIMEKVIEVITA